jgi:predicted Zn finger-like uncharacterized protein
MNNACPGCGAVYAVTSRDIGRKLKCKKCSTALLVTDAGLVVDAPGAAGGGDFDTGDAGDVVSPKKAKRYGTGGGVGEVIDKVGGIPTVLFGFGIFLVIMFYFMPKISEASVDRANGAVQRVQLDAQREVHKAETEKEEPEPPEEGADANAWTTYQTLKKDYDKNLTKKKKEITKKYKKPENEAKDDLAEARIGKLRSAWWDRYGLMFGFLFLSFGCIGYIRSDQPLLVKIVAGTILSTMMVFVFASYSGCQLPGAPPTPK